MFQINSRICDVAHLSLDVPERDVLETKYETINKLGIQAAVKTYESLRAASDASYDFSDSESNSLGYQLLTAIIKRARQLKSSS